MRRSAFQSMTVDAIAARMRELIQLRCSLPRDDLEYVAQQCAKLKDARLQACVAELIGWGDDERAQIETFAAIAIEVMRKTNPSKLREAARVVELRYMSKKLQEKA